MEEIAAKRESPGAQALARGWPPAPPVGMKVSWEQGFTLDSERAERAVAEPASAMMAGANPLGRMRTGIPAKDR